MLDPTDSVVQMRPLDEGADRGPVGPGAARALVKTKEGYWRRDRFIPMSRWRTGAFFLSLLLCLAVIFSFSFMVPCPAPDLSLRSWNRTFQEAATYEFLALGDANGDGVLDVLFVLKGAEGRLNTSCVNASLGTPCVFVSALTGTNGDSLWERPLAPELHWAQCGLPTFGDSNTGCLLSHADRITAIQQHSGEVIWEQPQPPDLNSRPPALKIPDLNGDGVNDLVLIGQSPVQTKLVILSGRSGDRIGSEVVLDSAEVFRHLLHTTAKGSHYVLFHKVDCGLYAQALWRIAAQALEGSEAGLVKDPMWEEKTSATSGQVQLYKSDSLRHVVAVERGSRSPHLLLVSEGAVELMHGDRLQPLWKVNTSGVLSEPTLGHYNKDGVPDVIIEEDMGNCTKKVKILDGTSGRVLWEVSLRFRPETPRPTAVSIAKSYSVFVFWGDWLSQTNSSDSEKEQFSYMLHPHYSNVLLEKSTVADDIIAFKVALMEMGRHASYVMLTGPVGVGARGSVTLTKRQLKEDIPESRVLRLGELASEETDQEIKEAFIRLHMRKDT
ncbi:protein FAM234A [Scleropages formosus]|uniref:protein FAM234A n=1 Tax=Scleropages formosus TaxID=113540 RepID=UPI0010FAB8C0|nr:protein FAM234A-like [Scleropages formosus]